MIKRQARSRLVALLATGALVGTALATSAVGVAAQDKTQVSLWSHSQGNPVEVAILDDIIADFNASQDQYEVEAEYFPQADYNSTIIAASLAGDLPCLLDVDGPVMPNWAWAGYLQPIDIDPSVVEGFLPGALGYWDDQLYAVGFWDAAKANFARKSVLEANDIRIPTLEEPWSVDEFDAILVTLQASGDFDFAWDPGMAWTGEWYPYAFSPLLQSAGGDIIDRETLLTAEGVLNGPEAVVFGEWWQSVFERELAPGTSQDGADRETGFIDGRYAIQFNGNWAAPSALDAFGDDLLFLPAVDFGNGPKIGAASWQYTVSSACANAEAASDFLEFVITNPEYLARYANETGLLPVTAEALALTEQYKEGASLNPFFALSNEQALLRPPTPAYLNAALVFEKAFADIANGADVQTALDAAVDEIDTDIESNDGYGF